jgi:hypothetical protein
MASLAATPCDGKRVHRAGLTCLVLAEAVHRGVNHTLSNLDHDEDPNPFVSIYKDGGKPEAASKTIGFERSEVI